MLEAAEVENAIRQETPMGEVYYIDKITGEKVIKGTLRLDGTLRKDIKIRPGYVPKDEQRRFVSKTQQKINEIRTKAPIVPGWDDSISLNISTNNKSKATTSNSGKNKKKNVKESNCFEIIEGIEAIKISQQEEKKSENTVSKDNKIRNLTKKLKEIEEIEKKYKSGVKLLEQQIKKMKLKNSILKELETLSK